MRILLAVFLLIASCVGAAAQGCGSTNPNCIVPTAPTNTNNNQAASTAFVQNQIAAGAIVPSVWPNDVYFGSGRPWVDVRSGSNGCAAAKGDAVTDDTAAIQCQINYMSATFNGGIVNVPLGVYLVSGGGLTIKGGVQLVGAGPTHTVIEALTDSAVITFDAATCNKYTALKNMWIVGYQNVAASQSTVTVGNNCSVIIRDDYIWFGLNGLNNGGVDSIVENSYICGYGDAIRSTGANWYIRVKADTCAITSTNAFEQLGSTALENHIIQSDFSGTYTNSVRINNSNAITSFTQSVFGNNISIVAANFTQIGNSEFGTGISIAGNGNVTLTNNFVLSGTLTPSGGLYNCSGNVNVICPTFSQSYAVIGATGTNCALVAGDQIWHNGTNQNLAVTVKQNLGTGVAAQSLNDACNAFEGWEIEATNVQISQGPLTLGLAGSVVGQAIFQNATSGAITVQPPTGALGAAVLTLPDVTDTLAGKSVANGGTGAATLTGIVVGSGTSPLSATQVTGAVKDNGSGTLTQAACADLSNAGTTCPTNANTGLTISGSNLNSNAQIIEKFSPGLVAAIVNTKGSFTKWTKAATVDNIEGSATNFTCTGNPTITFFECGTSTTCASSPVTIGTVTVTAGGTVVDGTVSNPAITAGDYTAWSISAGTCASLDIFASANIHSN